MDILIDTHILIWWETDWGRLDPDLRARLGDSANRVLVSAASIWEIAIKRQIGKLNMTGPLVDAVERSGFEALAISLRHAERAGALPQHHTDPFDRMLIAQAELERCVIATRDSQFEAYGIPLLRG